MEAFYKKKDLRDLIANISDFCNISNSSSNVCGRVGQSLISKVVPRYKPGCAEIPMARQGNSEVGECSADKYETAQSTAQTEQSSQPRPPDLLQFLHLQSG